MHFQAVMKFLTCCDQNLVYNANGPLLQLADAQTFLYNIVIIVIMCCNVNKGPTVIGFYCCGVPAICLNTFSLCMYLMSVVLYCLLFCVCVFLCICMSNMAKLNK